MLQSSPNCKRNLAPVSPITGYTLALSHAPAHVRAFTAAKLVLGRYQLVEPRVTQATRLARVNSIYTAAAIEILRGDDVELAKAVLEGRLPLLEAAALAKHPRPNLIKSFLAADANERLDLGRIAGVDTVFDAVISPLI
jgi:hypothetical protein